MYHEQNYYKTNTYKFIPYHFVAKNENFLKIIQKSFAINRNYNMNTKYIMNIL